MKTKQRKGVGAVECQVLFSKRSTLMLLTQRRSNTVTSGSRVGALECRRARVIPMLTAGYLLPDIFDRGRCRRMGGPACISGEVW